MTDLRALWRFQLNKSGSGIDRAVRLLIRDAYEHVSHVRQRFVRAGIQPDAIRTRSDLQLLPTFSRDDIGLLQPEELLRRGTDASQCVVSWTSGTSGRQLAVHMSRAEALYRQLLLYNAMRRNMRGRPLLSIAEVGAGSWKGPRTRRVMGLVRVTWVPRVVPVPEQAAQLAQSKPSVITGHPSCLRLVAEQVRREERTIRPQLVVCRGEVLDLSTRSLLAQVFKCRVADYYSCDEVGNIAWECPRRSGVLHVNSDGCVVDMVDEDGHVLPEGKEGSVVLTNLFNRTMPFIRYSLGDCASVLTYDDQCNCGFRGVSLSPIAGREMQFFRMADGASLSARLIASAVNRLIRELPTDYRVDGYQVIQDDLALIRVRLHSRQELPQEVHAKACQIMKQLCSDLRCTLEIVDELKPGPSGKFQRYVPLADRTDSV